VQTLSPTAGQVVVEVAGLKVKVEEVRVVEGKVAGAVQAGTTMTDINLMQVIIRYSLLLLLS